jgi:HPt (histidine-containing phosphotransfer) domain-containing protein
MDEREALIDLARVRELAASEDGVSEVMQEFKASSEEDIAMLRACLARKDARGAGRVAHRITGGARAMGAARLAQIAAEVEKSAGREDLAQLATHAASLAQELETLLAAMEQARVFDAVES